MLQHCRRCNVTIRNPHKSCPLCGGTLEGEWLEENRMFPDLEQSSSRFALGFRIFTFGCIAVMIAAAALNWSLGFEDFWSRYVLAGVVCTWLLTAMAVIKRRNLMKNFIWQMVLLWGVFLFWDWMTGWKGWSVDYALPGAWLAAFGSILAVIFITKPPAVHYLVYLMLLFAGSFVLLILLVLGVPQQKIPGIVSVAAGFLMLIGLLLFQGRLLLEELHKKVHL
ncbi:MAG: DUF6320 domain-containing protein [Lachnospiraceae bacterium]|nr:DUF6320 domain-containing protein [Lachnospiraceae bacterium]MDD3796781.1 DUF6320 domain-containing protein [Lachnospiraceae bacterium]